MTTLSPDKTIIVASRATFTPREQAAFEEYVQRLLSNGLLEEEDAIEAVCYRVLQGRADNGS